MKFAKPHGMRIVGSAFITDISWDNIITLRTAVHEMLHGNIDWESENMKQVIEILKKDDFVMDKIKNHNTAFGYNTLEGYLEENCVRVVAMDQIINEKFNINEDAKTRWKENDDGMHVFAEVLYYVMKHKNFYDSGMSITLIYFLCD
ncbi:MAG: hypothetical protein JXR48_05450 [Candidatus Delongbacteria bacterium]|nr:hypothetical protein [Candidatus Delongbacteria bacterium]